MALFTFGTTVGGAFGLWLHLWVFLVGGRNGVGQTIKAVMYGATPSCLLCWIPIVGIIAGIWATFMATMIGQRFQGPTESGFGGF